MRFLHAIPQIILSHRDNKSGLVPSHSAHPWDSPSAICRLLQAPHFFRLPASVLPLMPPHCSDTAHCLSWSHCTVHTARVVAALTLHNIHISRRSVLHCITTRPCCDQEETAFVSRFSVVTIFMATNAPAFPPLAPCSLPLFGEAAL